MKEQKLPEQVINAIKVLRDQYDEMTISFGALEIRKKQLDEDYEEVNVKYKETRESELKLLQSIQSQFGEGAIDTERGVYLIKEDAPKP